MSSYPPLTRADVLSFQFSSWYPVFSALSMKSTVIRPLDPQFRAYLEADGVHVPKGSEDVPVESTLPDENEEIDDCDEETGEDYAFPELDSQIRAAVKAYGAVFPKLNFSSPKDASWLLPSSSPLKCTTPADVYLLLKSSDFITHDLSADSVFEGCTDAQTASSESYELELVLRKWYAMDRSREMRCFVHDGALLGISQRDDNYYDFLNDPATQSKIATSVHAYWLTQIHPKWTATASYTFDILLTRDLARFHILDFNPYAPRTDTLLFTPEELLVPAGPVPLLRVIDSPAHPAATRNAPAHQHNMVPFEAFSLSNGRGVEEFREAWQEELQKGVVHDDEDEEGRS
ncbi:D123-domain-containing protein [Artomyces pyxidatus]|uniref:D123-domain-containing protein n=1 Tax=Artomyces pyxidatus TaxID=48021 RepID=A0ACB8T264_9AGAM|nr:D123-domain-containing protein [Artomyces pyxidatus]